MKGDETDHELPMNGSLLELLPKCSSLYSCIEMNGKEVFRFAVGVVPDSIELALREGGPCHVQRRLATTTSGMK